MKTNFDKAKEMWTIDMVTDEGTVSLCTAIHKVRNEKNCVTMGCVKCLEWLAQEYKEPILDDAEKQYLSAVIKPFKNRVKYIKKVRYTSEEYIEIELDNDEYMCFPYFKKGKMYKGMKRNKEYSLKDLGLE